MSFHRNSPPLLPIEVSMHQTLTTREKKSARRRLSIRPATSIDFSSNDYLSLSKSLLFRTRFLKALNESHPETPLGSGGSRLLDGNCQYAEQLETFIAAFHEAPSGLLFNSGFDANVGVFACIPQPGDIVVYDELIHASVHEGMRLSRAGERRAFKHNCPVSLRLTLQDIVAKDLQVHNGTRSVLVAVESLYSMDGDTAPLREIVQEVKALLPNGNGYVIVDEAHATGIYGHRGAGLVQEIGLQSDVLVRVHTFGKALASQGAIVLCSPIIRDYLINYARPLVYSTAMSYSNLVSTRTAYELLSEGSTESLRHNLRSLISELERQFSQSFHSFEDYIQIDHAANSPIFSVRIRHPHELAKYLQGNGLMVRAIMPPTVPKGQERLRICLHAGNTGDDIEKLVRVMREGLEKRRKADKTEKTVQEGKGRELKDRIYHKTARL